MPGGDIKLHDAQVLAAAAIVVRTFVDQRILQDAPRGLAVARNGQAFIAAIVLPARRDGGPTVGEIRAATRQRQHVRRLGEGADEHALVVGFIHRRTIFIGHQKIAVWQAHNAFGIQRRTEHARAARQAAGVEAAKHLAIGLFERDGIDNAEIADRAIGRGIHLEGFDARRPIDGAAAGTAIADAVKQPPAGIINHIRSKAQAVEIGADAQI